MAGNVNSAEEIQPHQRGPPGKYKGAGPAEPGRSRAPPRRSAPAAPGRRSPWRAGRSREGPRAGRAGTRSGRARGVEPTLLRGAPRPGWERDPPRFRDRALYHETARARRAMRDGFARPRLRKGGARRRSLAPLPKTVCTLREGRQQRQSPQCPVRVCRYEQHPFAARAMRDLAAAGTRVLAVVRSSGKMGPAHGSLAPFHGHD